MSWTTHETVVVVVLLVGLAATIASGYAIEKKTSSKMMYMFVGIHAVVYVALFIIILHKKTMENFFFEVSPTRKKCLMEQVSRKNFGKRMPCACCQKGTVGGIPPNYAQWLGPSDSDTSGWFRPDHVEYVNTISSGVECEDKPFKQPVYVEHV
jgi:hypothetical protein